MVKEITILKMKSLKNDDDKMGAMAEAIKQKSSNVLPQYKFNYSDTLVINLFE